jgi:hypothetical protein
VVILILSLMAARLHSDPYIDATSVNLDTWITYDSTTSRDDTSMIVPWIVRGLGLCYATM